AIRPSASSRGRGATTTNGIRPGPLASASAAASRSGSARTPGSSSAATCRSNSVIRMVDTVIQMDGRPRIRDRERTRRALLDAALAEFSEEGFAGARVSAIATRAGVNKQLISYYFGGKQGLRDALVAEWLRAADEVRRPDAKARGRV